MAQPFCLIVLHAILRSLSLTNKNRSGQRETNVLDEAVATARVICLEPAHGGVPMISLRTLAAVLCLSLGAVGAVSAQPIFMVGNPTCADWASSRNTSMEGNYTGYLVGFINGLSLASKKNIWLEPHQIDADQAAYWVSIYCQNNPLDTLVNAIMALVAERIGAEWHME